MRYVFAVLLAAFGLVVDIENLPNSYPSNQPSEVAVATADVSEVSPTEPSSMTAALADEGRTVAPPFTETGTTARSAEPDASVPSTEAVNKATPEQLCEVVKNAAEENGIPIGFFVRLLWEGEQVSFRGNQSGWAVQIKENAFRLASKAWSGKTHRSPILRGGRTAEIGKIRLAAARPNHSSKKLAAHLAVRLASATAR